MNLTSDRNEKKFIFSVQHEELYTVAYKIFLDNKIIGVGVKNFRKFCKDEKYYNNQFSCNSHPHNAYIQILSETGIVGFLFILVIFFYFCRCIFKHLMLQLKGKFYFTNFEICILSGILIYLWPFVPTGNVFNNWVNIILSVNLTLLVWSRTSAHK
jgi:O-antigen ligase